MRDQDSGQQPAAIANQILSAVEERIVRTDSQRNPNGPDKATANLAQDVHWITHATFWSQIGLGIIGVAALIIYGGQLRTMKSQLQQMQDDSKASSQQFQVQLGHYDAGLGVNQVQIGKLDDSIGQASRLASATETANKNVLENDRPWLSIVIAITNFTANQVPVKTVTISNSGKRPALLTNISADGDYFKSMSDEPPFRSPLKMTQFLVPGTRYESTVNLLQGAGILTQYASDALNAKKMMFFSYARVEYVDPRTGEKHFTHACVYYMPATQEASSQFVGCEAYNNGN